jgi:hypothetical protein
MENDLMPVDVFLETNIATDESTRDDNRTALFKRLCPEEYDALYGLNDEDEERKRKRDFYRDVSTAELTVLRECPHSDRKKVKHHPNYHRPYEVELLCLSCHRKAHTGTWTKYGNKLNPLSNDFTPATQPSLWR